MGGVAVDPDERRDGGFDGAAPQKQTMSRRGFLVAAGGLAVMVGLGGAVKVLAPRDLLRPPGGQDEAAFISRCLKCDRCLGACPTRVIGLAQLDDGLVNAHTPIMKFHLGACTFCGRCTEVCPTRALQPFGVTRSSFDGESVLVPDLKVGLAVVDRRRCIAWNHGTCEVCVKACPYGALSRDADGHPIVDGAACNGCGVCVHVCPALTARTYVGGTTRGIEVVPPRVGSKT
jgi:ferredoxin-type protein NapG